MLEELSWGRKEVVMEINLTKIKLLSISGHTRLIIVENETIETVNEIIYLGQIYSYQNQTEKEIDRRVALE